MTVRMRRRGFTLVELLVVISIIGMLAALLLPAVQNAREAGRKTQCINNQRQLGLAIVQFEQRQNHYPGYQNVQVDLRQVDSTDTRVIITGWVYPLLPFLERNDLYDLYGADGTQPGNRPTNALKLVLCPSDVQAETNTSDPNSQDGCSYIVNCGMRDGDRVAPGNLTNRDYPGNGVFHSLVPWNVVADQTLHTPDSVLLPAPGNPYDQVPDLFVDTSAAATAPVVQMSTSFITRGDGSATTLMLSENVDSRGWTSVKEEEIGFVWYPGVDANASRAGSYSPNSLPPNPPVLHQINELAGTNLGGTPDPNNDYRYARPSSFHPGGVVVTFCDAHTSFLNDSIDYLVYCLLMTPRGQHARDTGVFGDATAFLGDGSHQNDSQILRSYALTPLNEGDF